MEKIFIKNKNKNKHKLNLTKEKFTLLLSILGFFIGRISIFHMLNPIAIGYLGCLIFESFAFNIAIIFTCLGFFSKLDNSYISKYMICLSLIFFIHNFFKNIKNKHKLLYKASLVSLSIFISGLIVSFIHGFTTYYLILSILESFLTFCMCLILSKGIFFLTKDNKRILTNEEIISLSILIGSIISGSSDVFISNISFTHFFVILLLLFVSYIYGGTISGVVSILCSFLLVISGTFSSDLMVIFSISSILSGLIRNKGKILTVSIFIFSIYLFSLILNINLIDNILLFSILGSSTLFLTIPCKIKASLQFNNDFNEESATYTKQIKILTSNKLNTYASSFEKLSKTFYNLSDKKNNLDQQDITNLIDEVATKVCNKCDLKKFCWEKNFYSTYQTIFSILNTYEKNGQVEQNNISQDFINNCINISQFIDVLNRTFEIYKLNLMWKNKVIESRELVGQQLTGISNIIYELSLGISKDVSFNESLGAKIKCELESNGIPTKNVIMTESKKGRLELLLKVEPCYIPNKCSKTIIPLVNEILGKKMCRNCYECVITKENNESICSISLIEEQKFRITTSVVTTHKEGSKESGDSHSFLNLLDGNYLLALSDGMGSGIRAKEESKATIELLEDFMLAGFSKDLAINMINSVLFLKSSKETFATLDMCTIDLYTGFCEFIKIGAVSTFILHKGNVEIIKSSSLPVGILNNVEPEIRRKKLSSNDIIVMVTDGVIDSKNNIINKDSWVVNLLLKNTSKNPEEIANKIFEQTKENYNQKLKDDVTIIVARIWCPE